MNRQELTCFLMVAEQKSFTLAAQKLFMTQPAVSSQISHLEKSLGLTLFVRNYHEIIVTPEAEILIPLAKRLLTDLRQLYTTAQFLNHTTSDEPGKLKIGLYFSEQINPIINAIRLFSRQHQNIEVTTESYFGEELTHALDEGKIDVILGMIEPLPNIKWVPQMADNFVIWRSSDYIPQRQTSISVTSLKNKIMIEASFNHMGAYGRYRDQIKNHIAYSKKIVVHDLSAAIMDLTTLDAFTILPRKAITQTSLIRPLNIEGIPNIDTHFQVGLGYPASPTTTAQQFIDFCRLTQA